MKMTVQGKGSFQTLYKTEMINLPSYLHVNNIKYGKKKKDNLTNLFLHLSTKKVVSLLRQWAILQWDVDFNLCLKTKAHNLRTLPSENSLIFRSERVKWKQILNRNE